MDRNRKKRLKLGCLGVFLLIVLGAGWFYGPLVLALYHKGFFDAMLRGDDTKRYEGTSTDNLKAMRTALLGYEASEGQFPIAGGWMDAIENRLDSDVLKKGEAKKKLIYPAYLGQAGKYGYAFNSNLSGKYRGDIKDPKTPLVFESTSTGRNAAGDPAKLRKPGGLMIALDGAVLK